jgi:hypothetical protein
MVLRINSDISLLLGEGIHIVGVLFCGRYIGHSSFGLLRLGPSDIMTVAGLLVMMNFFKDSAIASNCLVKFCAFLFCVN